jgi:hypothetical protein
VKVVQKKLLFHLYFAHCPAAVSSSSSVAFPGIGMQYAIEYFLCWPASNENSYQKEKFMRIDN